MVSAKAAALAGQAGERRKVSPSLAEAVLEVIPGTVPPKQKVGVREALETLQMHRVVLQEFAETYEDALERSRETGRYVRFVVSVPPQGQAVITPAKAVEAREIPVELQDSDGLSDAEEEELAQALEAARGRGRARVVDILSRPEMLSAAEFAARIGSTRVTVNSKRHRRELLALEGFNRGVRYPEWQIGEDCKPFAALPRLFESLGDSPWAVYRFLVQQHAELGGLTGKEALARGLSEEVIEAAETVARNFS